MTRDMSEQQFKRALRKRGMRLADIPLWIELPEVNGRREMVGMVFLRRGNAEPRVHLRASLGAAVRRLNELEARR